MTFKTQYTATEKSGTENIATDKSGTETITLSQLGWKPFFQQQLTLHDDALDYEAATPARVVAQHRSLLELLTEEGPVRLNLRPDFPDITVGDWLLIDHNGYFIRLLERASVLSRKAPGSHRQEQLIAANIDTAFLVTSMNKDFSLGRIERYLSLVHHAGIEPVVVLTKADLCETPEVYVDQIRAMDSMLIVEPVNSLDSATRKALGGWCKTGQTVAFLGSSGVGKSTLVNCLSEAEVVDTGGIREDDSKGRHTTRSRSLNLLDTGGLLMDTPGMRELQIADCAEGVSETFSDIEELSGLCRFSDCSHQSEPACAVQNAVADGMLDPRRLKSFFKLLREQARNGQALVQRQSKAKATTRMHKSIQSGRRGMKQGL